MLFRSMEKELQNPDEAQKFTRLSGHDYKRIILLVSIVLIILAIPLVIFFIQKNQDTRQRATGHAADNGFTATYDTFADENFTQPVTPVASKRFYVKTTVTGATGLYDSPAMLVDGQGDWIDEIQGTPNPPLFKWGNASGLQQGAHSFQLVAYCKRNPGELIDGKPDCTNPGRFFTETTINVDPNQCPTITWDNIPANPITGQTFNTSITPTGGSVQYSTVLLDGVPLQPSSNNTWATTPATNGTHTLEYRVRDNAYYPDNKFYPGGFTCNTKTFTSSVTGTPTATPTGATAQCSVSFSALPANPAPNTTFGVTITKVSKIASLTDWDYVSLYVQTPPNAGPYATGTSLQYVGTGRCDSTTCTWDGLNPTPTGTNPTPTGTSYRAGGEAVNSGAVGQHRLIFAVHDNDINNTSSQDRTVCAATNTDTFTTGAFNPCANPTGALPCQTPTPPPEAIQVQFNDNIKLEGNSTNDNAHGTPPKSTKKTLYVELFNINDDTVLVGKGSGDIFYNPTTTNFGTGTGSITVSPITQGAPIPAGTYRVKVKVDKYLKKWAPGTITIPTTVTLIPVSTTAKPILLSAGDITNTNVIDLIGYNALIDCGAAVNNPLPKTNPVSGALRKYAACQQHTTDPNFNVAMLDLNDDGDIDSIDYAILTENLTEQHGD